MGEWKKLAGKAVQRVQEDGLLSLGKYAGAFVKKRIKEQKRKENEGIYRDVLFINGCDEHLPHPGRYRVTHQREQLLAYGISSEETYFADISMRQVRQYSVFLFFRCPKTEMIEAFIEKAKQYGKTVLYDIDDLVFDTRYTDTIPYVKSLNAADRQAYDNNVQSYGQLLDLCQGAVTTTEGLADALRERVQEVLINRNRASETMLRLSAEALRRKKDRISDGKVRLGYFSGSITHNPDMEMLLPVLVNLLVKYENLELVTVGELKLPEELEAFKNRITVRPFTDWRNLPEIIAQVDINLAPLEDTVFNRAKSENKWMEAALVQVVTVASKLGAFEETVEDSVTGFLCETGEDWEKCLSKLIEDVRLREETGIRAWEYCRQNYLTTYTGNTLAEFIGSHRRKNVGILLPALNISGGIMVAMQHGIFLRKAGYDVTILAENTDEISCVFEGEEFPVLPLKEETVQGHFDKVIATMWVTVQWLNKFPDVIDKYYLVQNYETDFYEPDSIYRPMANSTYCKEGIHYITISKWCGDWLEKKFGRKIRYAPNGLNLQRFVMANRNWQDKIRILIEGDCGAEHKNVDEAFRIVELLDREKYEIWYMSYNSEPKDWYHVDRFFHKVPFSEAAEVYQECHILLKSSILESFSYPPLEMMATGGIAVVRPNEGNQEYLVNEKNCLLYMTEREAVSCIERVVQDAGIREAIIAEGQKTAEERSWSSVEQQILKLYNVENI